MSMSWVKRSDVVAESVRSTHEYIRQNFQLWRDNLEYSLGSVDIGSALHEPGILARFFRRQPPRYVVPIEEVLDETIAIIKSDVSIFGSPVLGDYRLDLWFNNRVACGAGSCFCPNAFAFASPTLEGVCGIVFDVWLDRALFIAQTLWEDFVRNRVGREKWFADSMCRLAGCTFWPSREGRDYVERETSTSGVAFRRARYGISHDPFPASRHPYLSAQEFVVGHELGHIYSRHLWRAPSTRVKFAAVIVRSPSPSHEMEYEADFWGFVMSAYTPWSTWHRRDGPFYSPAGRSSAQRALQGVLLFFAFVHCIERLASRLQITLPPTHPPAMARWERIRSKLWDEWEIGAQFMGNLQEKLDAFVVAADSGDLPSVDGQKFEHMRLLREA